MAPSDPPFAGTGNLLLANPPFIMGKPAVDHLNDYLTYALHMDINQPAPTDGLPELTEDEFLRLSAAAGGSGHPFEACNYGHALRIARAAYRMGADVELEACCKWLREGGHRFTSSFHEDAEKLRAARRHKPLSLREQALEALNRQERGRDRGALRPEAMADADIIRRALEALPE